MFLLFISGLSSIITQWQLSIRHFQNIKMGDDRKVKRNYEKRAEKNSSTHSKTFIDQPACIWCSSSLGEYRHEKWQRSPCPMELPPSCEGGIL